MLVTALLTGCAQPGAGDPTATTTPAGPPASADAATPTPPAATGGAAGNPQPPSIPQQPGKPPKEPTDPMPDLLAGRITRGGTGPCYAMETDEGVTYALFWGKGVTLNVGDTVVVQYEQMRVLVDCGPGTPVSVVKLEIVG
jgi:hypothetical protein